MKIAAFYSDSPFAGWVQAEGFVDVLKRMGHEVTAIPIPPANQVTQAQVEKINKPIDDCELILVSGPEWLKKWITTFYKDWDKLKSPKVGWYHESFVREDMKLKYESFEKMFDFHFFPDKDDAEKYKGEFLPLGVDTAMFRSDVFRWMRVSETGVEKPTEERDIDVAFIGLMYPKRARFLEELKPHLGDIKIDIRAAMQSERGLLPAIAVYDFEGLNIRRSMQLLAETYRRIKVFVTFPSVSNVLVAKVLESMACGCTLVAPKQPPNVLDYFSYDGTYDCAQKIRMALKHGQPMGQTAAKHVHESHRMELRFEQIFSKVGLCQPSL